MELIKLTAEDAGTHKKKENVPECKLSVFGF